MSGGGFCGLAECGTAFFGGLFRTVLPFAAEHSVPEYNHLLDIILTYKRLLYSGT